MAWPACQMPLQGLRAGPSVAARALPSQGHSRLPPHVAPASQPGSIDTRRSPVQTAARRRKQDVTLVEPEPEAEPAVVDYSRKIELVAASLGVPAAHVTALVRAHPDFAALPAHIISSRVPQLAVDLQLPLVQALIMAARAPLVLDLPSAVLLARAEQLAGVTGLPTEQVVFLYARQPALLDYSPEQLTSAAGGISSILGCSQQGVLQLLARMDRPGLRSLLTMPPHMVPGRLQELVDSLGLPESSTNRLDIMRLVSKHPRLLSASPKDVNLACDALVAVFGEACDPAELAQFIRRAPQLLTYPHQQLSDNHRALMRCLGLPAGRVATLVRRSPRLLQVRPDSLERKLDALQQQLYITPQQILDLVISQPSLLCREPSSVASTIGALQHLLATSYQTAVAVLLRQPSIVGRSAAVLCQQHALLVKLTGLPAPRLAALLVNHPRLLTYGATNLASCASLVQEVLGVQGRELGELLEQLPEFLLHTITTLEAVGELQACLGLPMWQVARIVNQNPRVLRGGPSLWGDNMRALTWRLGVTPGRAVALVTALPALLVEPREALAAVAGELGAVAAMVPTWRRDVEGGPASHVAPWLRAKPSTLERLRWLAGTPHAARLSLRDLTPFNRAKFVQQYPEYTQQQRQQQKRRARQRRRQQQEQQQQEQEQQEGPEIEEGNLEVLAQATGVSIAVCEQWAGMFPWLRQTSAAAVAGAGSADGQQQQQQGQSQQQEADGQLVSGESGPGSPLASVDAMEPGRTAGAGAGGPAQQSQWQQRQQQQQQQARAGGSLLFQQVTARRQQQQQQLARQRLLERPQRGSSPEGEQQPQQQASSRELAGSELSGATVADDFSTAGPGAGINVVVDRGLAGTSSSNGGVQEDDAADAAVLEPASSRQRA